MVASFLLVPWLISGSTDCNIPSVQLEATLKDVPVFVSESIHDEIAVVLRVSISETGAAVKLEIVCSLPTDRAAEVAAFRAVEKWKFNGTGEIETGNVVVHFSGK